MRDLISRQAAIDALHMHLMYRMGTDSNKKRLDEWINNLPSVQPVATDTNVGDTISRKGVFIPNITVEMFRNASLVGVEDLMVSGEMEDISLPSAQPEQPTEVQDILQYLDEYLHPIVSPEHWSVYSELYDMVSMLPSAQPEEAIPVSWIEARIERFEAMDNSLSGLTASIIRTMLNEWKKEQKGDTT